MAEEQSSSSEAHSASEVSAGLKRGTLTVKKSKVLKSDIWRSFSLVYNAEGNQLPFACCDKCQKVLTYNGHKSGTSGLNRHVCTVLKGQQLLEFKGNSAKVTDALKAKTVEKCVDYVAADLRPYDSIAGRGLVQLAQHLVDTAATIGKFDVRDILPHPTTVSRHVDDRALKWRRAVVDDISETIGKYGCAVTTDVWTETYRKTSFLSATLHFINSDYKLQSRVLFSAPFDDGTSKTGENIRALLFQNLRAFGIDCSVLGKKIVFVTDRGANMVASLRGFTRLNCSAHVLNSVLSHALSPTVMSEVPDAGQLISDAKKLVSYFKHSGLQVKLTKSLKQSVETRWNSTVDMLDSISQQYDEVTTVLLENNQYDKISCINKQILASLVAFLKPFKDATNDLESDNTALSAALVLPWSVKLREHCEVAKADPLLSAIASACAQRLDALLSPSHLVPNGIAMLYKVATFLTPKLRHLRMINANERQYVMEAVKEMSEELGFDVQTDESAEPPPPKKVAFRGFEEWEDVGATGAESESLDFEIDDYLKVKLIGSESHQSKDILLWWKKHCYDFPTLAKLARHVLAIPGPSAPSERAFSICGRILEERRSMLKPSTVNNLLFLHGCSKNPIT